MFCSHSIKARLFSPILVLLLFDSVAKNLAKWPKAECWCPPSVRSARLNVSGYVCVDVVGFQRFDQICNCLFLALECCGFSSFFSPFSEKVAQAWTRFENSNLYAFTDKRRQTTKRRDRWCVEKNSDHIWQHFPFVFVYLFIFLTNGICMGFLGVCPSVRLSVSNKNLIN